jgi:flagellar basal-body rod protein FlgB
MTVFRSLSAKPFTKNLRGKMQVGMIDVYSSILNAGQQRADLIANNIANSDTPNYKAVDISFADTVTAQLSGTTAPAPEFRDSTTVGLNGNDVSLDSERVEAAANGESMVAATTFLHQSTADLVTALRPNPSGI